MPIYIKQQNNLVQYVAGNNQLTVANSTNLTYEPIIENSIAFTANTSN